MRKEILRRNETEKVREEKEKEGRKRLRRERGEIGERAIKQRKDR
jgi:hypothetical protein